jgi:hypothetical protein
MTSVIMDSISSHPYLSVDADVQYVSHEYEQTQYELTINTLLLLTATTCRRIAQMHTTSTSSTKTFKPYHSSQWEYLVITDISIIKSYLDWCLWHSLIEAKNVTNINLIAEMSVMLIIHPNENVLSLLTFR